MWYLIIMAVYGPGGLYIQQREIYQENAIENKLYCFTFYYELSKNMQPFYGNQDFIFSKIIFSCFHGSL